MIRTNNLHLHLATRTLRNLVTLHQTRNTPVTEFCLVRMVFQSFGSPEIPEMLVLESMEAPDEEKKPAPQIADIEDDFDEPLGERQPEANEVIVCAGGCE